jgi:hypothetical protein
LGGCYKKQRFACSFLLYVPIAFFLCYPTILHHPLLVLAQALVTAANFFIISSFLVGPVAAIFKLTVNTDLRGRVAELVTVVATISTAFHCYGPLSLLITSNADSCSGVERQLTAPLNIIPFTAPLAVTVKEVRAAAEKKRPPLPPSHRPSPLCTQALASFPQTPVVVLGAALAQRLEQIGLGRVADLMGLLAEKLGGNPACMQDTLLVVAMMYGCVLVTGTSVILRKLLRRRGGRRQRGEGGVQRARMQPRHQPQHEHVE